MIFLCDDAWDNFDTKILEKKYKYITIKEVAAAQKYLSKQQQLILEINLKKKQILFNGKLGHYHHKKFHIDLADDAKVVFKKAYRVPFQEESLFKNKL